MQFYLRPRILIRVLCARPLPAPPRARRRTAAGGTVHDQGRPPHREPLSATLSATTIGDRRRHLVFAGEHDRPRKPQRNRGFGRVEGRVSHARSHGGCHRSRGGRGVRSRGPRSPRPPTGRYGAAVGRWLAERRRGRGGAAGRGLSSAPPRRVGGAGCPAAAGAVLPLPALSWPGYRGYFAEREHRSPRSGHAARCRAAAPASNRRWRAGRASPDG